MSNFDLTLTEILADVPAGPFASALRFTLDHEGVRYEEVPGNSGGPTCCGIAQADYDAHRHEHGLPAQSIHLISATEVTACYFEHYWEPLRSDDLPEPLAIILFDSAVSVGVVQTVRWLQKTLGVIVDGCFGSNTMATVDVSISKQGVSALAASLLKQREDYYRSLGPWADRFKAGCLARCVDLAESVGVTAST